MTPLDLRVAPPRPPRAELAGVIFLPRTIDKFRASLPGGHLGDYSLAGHSDVMLATLGSTLAAARDIVARATSDDDVAAELLGDGSADAVSAWSALIVERKPRGGDRAAAIAAYPWLVDRPDLILSLDVLAEDDRLTFGL